MRSPSIRTESPTIILRGAKSPIPSQRELFTGASLSPQPTAARMFYSALVCPKTKAGDRLKDAEADVRCARSSADSCILTETTSCLINNAPIMIISFHYQRGNASNPICRKGNNAPISRLAPGTASNILHLLSEMLY